MSRVFDRMQLLVIGVQETPGTYALLHEVTELSLIFDLDELLAAIGRVGDVQLHLGGVWRSKWSTGCWVCWEKKSASPP